MVVPLRYIGDPILRRKCKKVETINDEILDIAEKLLVSMKAHNGAGLAAPQIGYEWRMFAVGISDKVDRDGYALDSKPKVFINPEITFSSKKTIPLGEACLSIPGFSEEVIRPIQINVCAMDIEGNLFEEKGLQRWRSRCVQHELDHLDGILFVDRLSDALKEEHDAALKMIELQHR